MLVRYIVEDYDKWKSVYNPDAANRKASGPKGASIFHNTNDPNEMIVLLKWNDMNKAKEFAELEGLRQRMQKGGVLTSRIYFLNKMEEPLLTHSKLRRL